MPAAPRGFVVACIVFATFVDIVAYSIAVPVLPDLAARFGASPTVIGLLFASFGATLLVTSVPAGTWSDRMGRRGLILGGLTALAVATLLFAFARSLPWLFAARLTQGAADAVTWIVGFALIADLYGPEERGRIIGIVMSGSGFAFMIGPSLGGWLYELGGMRLPFLAVAGAAVVAIAAFAFVEVPLVHTPREPIPIATLVRKPDIAVCTAAVLAIASTLAMLEPIVSIELQTGLGVSPARVGLLFAAAACATAILHPVYGHLADRWGARRLTMAGLAASACVLPFLGLAHSFTSALALFVVQSCAGALAITPSLAYMGQVVSAEGAGSFGVAYGLYNFAWGAGILVGPAAGGFLYERMGFARLMLVWTVVVVIAAAGLARVQLATPAPEGGTPPP